MALGFHTSVFKLCCGTQMGHKIKYGANIFLKIIFFPYLPTHFWHVTGNQHIIYFGLVEIICTSGGDVYYASRNLLFTCFQKYINYTVYNYTLYLDKVFV